MIAAYVALKLAQPKLDNSDSKTVTNSVSSSRKRKRQQRDKQNSNESEILAVGSSVLWL